MDIEAYEMDQTKITEIGVSTLDTLNLINVPPGEGGAEWMKKIRYVQLGVFLFQSKKLSESQNMLREYRLWQYFMNTSRNNV